jgi:hypothetical protein
MISSIVVRKETNAIQFTKIEIDLVTGKVSTKEANYEINDELREHVLKKHRVYLPCKIIMDQDIANIPYGATLYVPSFWEDEAIENYTQALLDELHLFNYHIPGYKTIKQIEQTFGLEMLLL